MIAEDCAAVIETHLGDVTQYLTETSSVPFAQPADAAIAVVADLHDIMVTLGCDFKEHGELEAVRYFLHSLGRLAVNVRGRVGVELNVDVSSRIAKLSPDVEGVWPFGDGIQG